MMTALEIHRDSLSLAEKRGKSKEFEATYKALRGAGYSVQGACMLTLLELGVVRVSQSHVTGTLQSEDIVAVEAGAGKTTCLCQEETCPLCHRRDRHPDMTYEYSEL